MKANSNQAVHRALSPRLGAGIGRGLRGRAPPGARRRRPAPTGSSFPASARRRARSPLRSTRASSASTSNPSPSSSCSPQIADGARGRTAAVAIRVNPDVDARTHAKITTGKSENKFGIPISRARAVYARAASAAGHRGHRRRHAYRQPDHRPRSRIDACLSSGSPTSCASCAPTATTSTMSIPAAASAFPTATTTTPPPHPDDYAEMVKRAHAQARRQVHLRARAG